MRKLSSAALFFNAALLVTSSIVSLNISAEAGTPRYTTGYAYDLKTDELLYTESHQDIYDGEKLQSSLVTYRSADTTTIASKRIDYAANPFLPDFRLEDARTGHTEGAKKEGDEVLLFSRDSTDEQLKEKRSTIAQPAVADAGFSLFIKDNWDALLAGETVKFNFAVPSRRDYFGFHAHKIDGSEHEGRPAVVIKIEMANPLIGLLADPIVVTYDMQTQHLVEYRGISNIRDTQGSNYQTRIVYPLNEISAAAPPL